MKGTSPIRKFRKGEIILREGEKGDCAYIIEQGSVEIVVRKNRQSVQIGTRGKGALIGEMAIIDDKPRTATIRALEDCDVIEITREDFARRVGASDPIVQMVMHVIMARYRDMLSRARALRFLSSANTEAAEMDDAVHGTAIGEIKVFNELKSALDRGELLLHYQPIVDVKKMEVAGFEALMRWKHPERGLIAPGIFIPVAEETGLIVDMTRHALDIACADVAELEKAAGKPVFVGVNFSARDFMTPDFFTTLNAALEKKKTDPSRIHIEVTESLLMEAPEAAKQTLEACRKAGFDISIDDFGSGYSSLSYLHFFPIDTLKIDQSFVRSMLENDTSKVLVTSIVGLARNLGMKIIAEGIEKPEEARFLRDLGCDYCQGYYFSRPLPLSDAAALLKSGNLKKI